jgi:signal transduction histidine kinase
MSALRDAPIRRKLLVITTLTVGLSLALAGVVFYIWDYRMYRQYVMHDVGTTANLIAENVNAAVAFHDAAAASEVLSSLRAKPFTESACVYDRTHAVLAFYTLPGAAAACPKPVAVSTTYRRGRIVSVFRPVTLDGKVVGTLFLSRSLEDVDQQLDLQSALLVAIMAIALGLGLLLSNRLHRLVSVPLVGLAATAREIASRRDYSLRARRYGSDELGTLVDAFNDMLAQIQERTAELQKTKGALEHTVAELQDAHRVKDEFLATVSHELRTPLNAVLGWARMLKIDDGMDDEKRGRALDSIERNAKAQARIVDDLLDVSRIVSGKLRLELKPLDLARVVATAVDAVRPVAQAREVELTANLQDVAETVVLGDADRLEQMVWNLVSNAVKFTPAGGAVRVELDRGDQIELRITDTGRGIDPEFLPHAFDLFRQADSSSTREVGGLGLGLTIAHRIAELHGGTIVLLSDGKNRGTTAIVRLPVFSSRSRAALA